ncbi:GNAT family N-acetyltransferase [Flavobacterium sp. '19STA2R22 D10 B1']|uniref:GNAT family N-acetyltransferase n=1 Tax=Flavobacterium aerium TaxID=3037261 RepID=UPI00278C0AF4|nr:GNAT family N-acetyltransferase [Flavobacterium sp. '19STA2R22 D10 B1']
MAQLETDRLQLRYLTLDDSTFIYTLLNTPEWIKYIGDRDIKSLDDARNYITNGPFESYEKNGFGPFVVQLKESNIPIGLCGLYKRDGLDDVDIGFAFLSEYSGKGYAYEAASTTLEYAKTTLNMNSIAAITVEYNISSINLIKKIGLTFEKIIRIPNDPEDLMLFVYRK